MSAITWGSQDVVTRLRPVRRRLNSLVLQHSAYVTVGLALLTLAVVLLAAVRANPWVFRLTFWGAVSLTSTVFLLAGLRLRRRWMTLPEVARLADRLAHMDDRLSTVVTRSASKPTRLEPVLLAQVAMREKHWQVGTLVPRRIARSILFPIASFCAVLTTVWAVSVPEPRPPEPVIERQPARQDIEPESPRQQLASETADRSEREPAPTSRESGVGTATSDQAEQGNGAERSASGTAHPRGTAQKRARPHGMDVFSALGSTGADRANETERLQALIRESLGVEPLAVDRNSAPSPGPSTEQASAGETADRAQKAAAVTERQHTRTGSSAGESRSGDRKNLAGRGGRLPSGSSTEGAAGQLFSSSQRARGGSAMPAMPLTLGTHSNAVHMRLQPGTGDPDAGGFGAPAPPLPPAASQVPDDPVQRPIVPPEQEAIVQRIFEPES